MESPQYTGNQAAVEKVESQSGGMSAIKIIATVFWRLPSEEKNYQWLILWHLIGPVQRRFEEKTTTDAYSLWRNLMN